MERIAAQLQTLITTIAVLIEAAINRLPSRIIVDNVLRAIMPARRVSVVSVTVAGTSTYAGDFSKGDDVVIDYVTAYCSDSTGLNAFRISLEDEVGTQLMVTQDTAKDGTLTRPRAAQMLPATASDLSDRPSLMFFLPKEKLLYFQLENASGTPSYTVELTIHYRVVSARAT